MPNHSQFASLSDLGRLKTEEANSRSFTGDGSPFLPVPGLQGEPERIIVSGQELPLVEERRYPTDSSDKHFETVEEKLVHIETDEKGVPVLIRSSLSNHGVWQKGAAITIIGQWAEEPAAPPANGKKNKGDAA